MLLLGLTLICLLLPTSANKLVASQRNPLNLARRPGPRKHVGLDFLQAHFRHKQVSVDKAVSTDTENVSQADSSTPLLMSSLPLAWLHIPKAGSSLANAIIHTPGVCPLLPQQVVINEESFKPHNDYGWGMLNAFNERYPVKTNCEGNLAKWGYHAGVGTYYESMYKGHGIVMFRQPEKRIISSWNGYHHSLPDKLYRLKTKHMTVRQYAQWIQGCAVRMLVRNGGYETCVSSKWPTQAEINQATTRLQEGFVFVGLTEEWQLSMCLFRKMFGGRCQQSDILNIRPANTDVFNATIDDLEGFTDRYDGKLYKVAKQIFQNKLDEFGLTPEICQKCYENGDW